MSTDKERLERLEASYRKLLEQHEALREAIQRNYAEIQALSGQTPPSVSSEAKPVITAAPQPETPIPAQPKVVVNRPQPKPKSDWEHFIGEQLLSKIGIAVLIIGVGIGAKYAIDHNLMSPVMRIIGGYAIAAILGFFAYRFRNKYEGFSAILVSGAMAVIYFMSYAGFVFYHLYPYSVAFGLLLLTTIGTVVAALRYNQVVIAHIGLVGAYVLPILISANASNIANYFAYMAVINVGILAISFLRNWRSLYYVAYGWTTIVFASWVLVKYNGAVHYNMAFSFTILFFVLFQAASLAYPFVRKKAFEGMDLFLVIPNMLSFFTIGQYLLYGEKWGSLEADFVFGLLVSAIFFALWLVFRRMRSEDQLLQESHFVIGAGALTLTFLLTLEGAHLPLILIVESCLFGWLALQSRWRFLDIFSTVLICIAGLTLLFVVLYYAWDGGARLTGLPGKRSFVLLIAGAVVAAGTYTGMRKRFERENLLAHSTPDALLLLGLIGGFVVLMAEIFILFDRHYIGDRLFTGDFSHYMSYRAQWNSSLLLTVTAFTGVYWAFVAWIDRTILPFRNNAWMTVMSIIVSGFLLLLMTFGSINVHAPYKGTETWLITCHSLARYVTFGAIAAIVLPWMRGAAKNPLLLTALHIAVLWIFSLELTYWLNVSGNANGYKLSLSILWGIYAIYMLYIGIVRSYAALRVAAMIVLGITLAKLFFFDIARLSTIAKTALFILLGGLLLTGAYFYQRYKASEEEDEKKPE